MLLWDRLRKSKLIALLSPERVEDCVLAYEALNPLGVVLEVAMRTPIALDGIKEIKQKHPHALILAGTVMTLHQADLVMDAGVAGVVSADYVPIVTEACARRDIMHIPGGIADAGKQLVQKAELYNCELDELRVHHPYQWVYKLFPAMACGTMYLNMVPAWKSVFNDLMVIYTGGVNAENLNEIMSCDPDAVICGSSLTKNVRNRDQLIQDNATWLRFIQGHQPQMPAAQEVPSVPVVEPNEVKLERPERIYEDVQIEIKDSMGSVVIQPTSQEPALETVPPEKKNPSDPCPIDQDSWLRSVK